MFTKEKVQEMANDLGIPFILLPDGTIVHHPSELEDPPGVVVIRPQKPWMVSPHGAPVVGESNDPKSG